MNIKNRKIIYCLIIIIVVILVGGGIITYLFLKTDKFKTNEELFWKYMSQNSEIVNVLKYQQDERYQNKSYNQQIDIDFDTKEPELNNFNVSINTKKDNDTKKIYSKIDTNYKNEKIFNLEYLKNDETYAIKNTEVANGYIAIQNDNLKEFAKKIGSDTTEIPDKLTIPNYSEMLNISNEEKQHIIKTYRDVIRSNINKGKYIKNANVVLLIEGKTYTTNAYSVTLTQREFKNLVINTLETLRTDSITLNLIATKTKSVNKDSEYASINKLNNKILNEIEKIKNIEVTDEELVTITVYENEGKTISTSIDIINRIKIVVSYRGEENKIIISHENPNNIENDWAQIIFATKNSKEEEKWLLNIKLTNNTEFMIDIKKEKMDSGYKIDGKIDAWGNLINIKGELILSERENILEISDTTNIILNDLEKEKLNLLLTRLKQQVEKVIKDKQKMIDNSSILEE